MESGKKSIVEELAAAMAANPSFASREIQAALLRMAEVADEAAKVLE